MVQPVFLEGHLDAGRNVLLDIDVQGARQILERYPQAITVFIAPPSMDVLRQRLIGRGSDDLEVIELRLINARDEMACQAMYRHTVVNDDLAGAIEQFVGILADGAH